MASINDAFPSAFLKADDLKGHSVSVVIERATIEELGKGRDKDRKIIIAMVGKEKKFVCNKTNANTIAQLYGPELDDWAGQRITLLAREVEFQGDMVLALRVSLTPPSASPARQAPPPPLEPAPTPPPAPARKAAVANIDDDVPF